jgi:MFS family permease
MDLFIKPMGEELGIGQSCFGFAQTARLIGFAATSWFIGRHLDRHGARLPLVVAGLVMGGSVMAMAAVTDGWQVVLLLFIGGLTGLAGFGGNLYTTVPVSRWFLRNRGKALSMAFLGTPIGIFLIPPITQLLIDGFGWRDAWLILGISGTVLVVVLAIAIVRRQPEDMGLLPDGVTAPSEVQVGAAHCRGRPRVAAEISWTREEAMRSSAFWRLAMVDGLRMGAMGTAGIFRVPYFIDQGVDAQLVALALSFEAVFGGLISIPTGWATDRFDPRLLSAASTVVMIITFIVTIGTNTTIEVFLASALFGLGLGSFQVSQGAVWPNYFGSANIGKIRGIAMPIGLSLSAISAPLTGIIKDSTGEYLIAWYAAAIALGIGTIILLITPKPVHQG